MMAVVGRGWMFCPNRCEEKHRKPGPVPGCGPVAEPDPRDTRIATLWAELAEVGRPGTTPQRSAPECDDFDDICNGCGESVAEPHSWAECARGMRSRVAGLTDALSTARADGMREVQDMIDAKATTARNFADIDKRRGRTIEAGQYEAIALALADTSEEIDRIRARVEGE